MHQRQLPKNITCVGVIISIITYLCVVIHIATPKAALEIGMTAFAGLICIIVLRQIYLEHEACHHQEQQLKSALIEHICQQYADLPEKKAIQEYVEDSLAKQSSPYARIKTIMHYQKNKAALEPFIDVLRQRYSEISVLKNLGLRWDSATKAP